MYDSKCMVPKLMSTQLQRMLGMCILTFLAKKKKIPGTGMSLD